MAPGKIGSMQNTTRTHSTELRHGATNIVFTNSVDDQALHNRFQVVTTASLVRRACTIVIWVSKGGEDGYFRGPQKGLDEENRNLKKAVPKSREESSRSYMFPSNFHGLVWVSFVFACDFSGFQPK